MKNANNLSLINQQKKNKRLCRILAVIIVALMFISSSFMVASAAVSQDAELGRSNSWGLVIEQVDIGYFNSVEQSGFDKSNWSIIRQRCYLNCKTLARTFNNFIVETNYNKNIIKQLEYCYQHGRSGEAVTFGNKWNTIHVHVIDAINDTRQLVGYGTSIPTVNGEEVTTEQYQNLYSIISNQYDELYSLAKDVSALYSKVKQEEDYNRSAGNNPAVEAINNSKSLTNRLWSLLGGVIIDFGSGNSSAANFLGISVSSQSIEQTANMFSSIFKTLAYAVAVILFGVNITTTSLQNEILTLRGGVKVFARVILVKIWIDLAIPICIYVINIFNGLTSQIMTQYNISGNGNAFANEFVYNTSSSGGAFEAIVGWVRSIFEFFKILITGSPILLLFLVMAVCILIVMVKMVARIFELTCLVAVAPVFFATLVGEETRRYFRKFLSAFLSTAGYIVFASITYIIATKWVAQNSPNTVITPNSLVDNTIKVLPCAIIIIACCRVVIKPPKVLTSLLDG